MKTVHIEVDVDESLLSILKVSAENSGQILKQLSAVTLFQAKKISLQKAAEIAGLSKREFEDFLFDLGITHESYSLLEYEKDKKLLGL
jgi:predicted HTH domain antitoxin